VQIYLVGGAVRDALLNYPVKDKDYLVTGATIEQMTKLGYQQVGKSFPVFLHPESSQEYALARTEVKQGAGYTGFVCDFSPEITIEQDLIRRDLTINAMAQSEDGDIIDPYNGQEDLKAKTLRHVSDAFVEDPLRVLRVARFAARYHHLGFTIADETLTLMQQIADSGELASLVPERVWQETQSALAERSPEVFFQSLRAANALKVIFPELDALYGVPNPPLWHPEIDTGIHTMMVLQQACKLTDSLPIRFAALVHDLGKGLTPKEHWPKHHGHENTGLPLVKALCERVKAPNEYKELALLVCQYHTHTHKAFELKPSTVIKLFDGLDAWRKQDRFEAYLTACTADLRGRTGFENKAYPQADYLRACFNKANEVSVQDIIAQGYKGQAIREQLTKNRIESIRDIKQEFV
jgi:tRNA nucleotidyltransferase (CCA-adding enzyme)